MPSFQRTVLYAACCTLSFCLPLSVCAQEVKQASTSRGSAETRSEVSEKSAPVSLAANDANLPDSPGAELAKSQADSAQTGGSSQTPQQKTGGASQTQQQQPPPSSDNQKLNRPVGTAAAEAPKVTGITAAEPAGVAIAPAKQKRVRTLVLKVGAIVGASVALGTVIALTAGTSSKPPGAH